VCLKEVCVMSGGKSIAACEPHHRAWISNYPPGLGCAGRYHARSRDPALQSFIAAQTMETISFTGIPTFHIHDVAEAKAFYVDHLGFALDWEHYYAPGAPVYMQVSRNGLLLHLTENERFPQRVIAFVQTTGVEAFRLEVNSRSDDAPLPAVETTAWGTLQLEVPDPFGNLLRFNQNAGAE